MRVGFVGLGIMGSPMALNVLKAGHAVTAYNRSPGRIETVIQAGAISAATPRAAAAGAEVVILMVTDDAAVRAVAEGPNGVLSGLEGPGIILDMSTISPAVTRDLAGAARQRGLTWLDAPVTGGDIGARDGTLTIMVGGPLEAFQRVKPLLAAMGQRIVYAGSSGMGQSMKLVGNLISGLTLLAAAEGLKLAEAAGLSRDVAAQVLPFSSARSFELEKALDRLERNDYAPGFSVANRTKDLRLAVEMAEQLGFPPALGAVAFQVWSRHAETYGPADETSILKRWNGLGDRARDGV